jgi:hypothetical protein
MCIKAVDMSRMYFLLTAPVLLILILVMVLIRAQPYDDYDLRTVLLPTNCTMPCFMGIRPGVTTMEEAVQLLRASGWVAQVQDDPSTVGFNAITWTWNERRPAFIRADSQGLLLSHTDANMINIVDRIRVETTVPFGYAALLAQGEVAPITSGPNGSSKQAYLQITDYSRSMVISSIVPCPVTQRKFLDAPARIEFDRQGMLGSGADYIPTDFYCWRHLK